MLFLVLAATNPDYLHSAGVVLSVAIWELVKFIAGLRRGRALHDMAEEVRLKRKLRKISPRTPREAKPKPPHGSAESHGPN